jgi:hypothetical protein
MSERDPELEKLYREHSREEPSSALDAKILAAAHRAVDSGPRKAGAEATRPQRWWMPLAAAAAIGVIAIGVVQQMPHETAIDPTWDTPHPSSLPPQGKRDPVTAPAPATPGPASPPAPATQAPPAPAPAPITQGVSPPPARPPAATMEQRKPAADDAARARKQKEAPAAPPPPPAPAAAPAMPQSAPASPPRESKLAAEPVPFPAAPAPAEKKAESTSADAAKRDAPAEHPMAVLRKDSASGDGRRAPAAGAAMAPRPSPAARASEPSSASSRALERELVPRARPPSDAAGNVAQSQRFEQEMQTLARDPDAWIARIRKLRDEGNTAQALRELREFRALVPDAERKLPEDLKSLQP